ncbi:putative Hydroxyindole O-methyltransferase [Seiridium cardinale]|uniref:Hydroxyindole O-methyltransferase n=1 Tax=Seiridium cardinale TaxID=138064 RepID=A0ABR2Y1Y8_9PEZI
MIPDFCKRSPSQVSLIVNEIVAAAKEYEKGDTNTRAFLVDLSHDLIAQLETPSQFPQRTFWIGLSKAAICRITVDLGILPLLLDAGKADLTVEELATKTRCDPGLLQRLMAHLLALELLSFNGSNICGTVLSNGLAKPGIQECIRWLDDVSRPPFNQLPSYFQAQGYVEPTSPTDCPLQHALKIKGSLYDWKYSTPSYDKIFGSLMAMYRAGQAEWFDSGFYPVRDRLIVGFDPCVRDVLLVDVGGNNGSDLTRFAEHHAGHPGRLILQDLHPVVSLAADGTKKIPFQTQAHDFFGAQPIYGARATSCDSPQLGG